MGLLNQVQSPSSFTSVYGKCDRLSASDIKQIIQYLVSIVYLYVLHALNHLNHMIKMFLFTYRNQWSKTIVNKKQLVYFLYFLTVGLRKK